MGCHTINCHEKERVYMKFFYLYICILFAIVTSTAVADESTLGSFSENESSGNMLLANDTGKLINESRSILEGLESSNAPSKGGKLFVIGEVALSLASKNLDRLSNDPALKIETGEFTELYSEMSSAFGIKKIPIQFIKYEPQERQISIDNNFSSEIGPINIIIQDQLEPNPTTFFMYDISNGHREASGGVEVIWDY